MKHFVVFVFLLFSLNTAAAQYLCSPSCTLTISFPAGGSIQATTAMTFMFGNQGVLAPGEAGTINTAVQPADLDFSAGGELGLSAGDSISFGNGGLLDLGVDGNVDAGSYLIVSSGDISIVVSGSNGLLNITGGLDIQGDMTISAANAEINSDVSVGHDLSLSSNASLTGSGIITLGDTGSVTSAGSIILDAGTFSPADISLQQITADPATSVNLSTVNLNSDMPMLQDLSLLDGQQLVASDGNSCVVVADECVADDGNVYVLSDGQLVPAATSGGVFNGISLLVLLLGLLSRKIAH